ncbi:hypothetical protein HMPREF0731_3636 [Pseudoroseomonas cervicalis ATCC 49957]|uniref:Uncharacterized protein n=1 Tax=Pseudoroseomonas cervicalis ATCC 49957 TaxID=525371 RepID=D5RRC4_9PROT|nr:hypothetical protein HMPREF0731_3636 [Pseudoroseomonas cervicalis ATCC 49957]
MGLKGPGTATPRLPTNRPASLKFPPRSCCDGKTGRLTPV